MVNKGLRLPPVSFSSHRLSKVQTNPTEQLPLGGQYVTNR